MLRRHGTESFKVERRIALIVERSGGLRRLRSETSFLISGV